MSDDHVTVLIEPDARTIDADPIKADFKKSVKSTSKKPAIGGPNGRPR